MKATIDPPIGCSMLSVRPSLHLGTSSLNMESIRNHFNSLPSTLLSRWHALQRLRLPPRLPSNGSMSRQSMAYLHKSTQYLKQVPGLLKNRVASLRNSSLSYDDVQGRYNHFYFIFYFLLFGFHQMCIYVSLIFEEELWKFLELDCF